jgi:hypothetical protein
MLGEFHKFKASTVVLQGSVLGTRYGFFQEQFMNQAPFSPLLK